MQFKSLAYANARDLVFGRTKKPLRTRRGLVLGGGKVYPELNFTLPPMLITETSFPEIRRMYEEIVRDACSRAVELELEGFVIEFETLIEMTTNPQYAIELTSIMNGVLDEFHKSHGLATAIRITPNDTREMVRPPRMRSGDLLEKMFESFEGCAKAGAEFLSIESTGGKEIHDEALMNCDLAQVIYALAVLGVRDMDFLWSRIQSIATKTKTIAAGDTACGFGNTAMVLADRKMIPKVFAAVVRAVTTVRSLVAYEAGAVGPGKDCGYENVYLKAITGFPMAMEGKSATCAHLSPVGNIAGATCDLWSNESVQNIKLLGAMAPTVSLEQLTYDCRLMNEATQTNEAVMLRDLMVRSDAALDPQAYILSPESAVIIADSIVRSDSHYAAALNAARTTIDLLKKGREKGNLRLENRELSWLDTMAETISEMPDKEEAFIEKVYPTTDLSKYRPEEYGLAKSL